MLRLLWGLLLLVFVVSPLLALALLVIGVILLRPFRRKEYGRPAVTLRGEVVRSESEKVIADWFTRHGIAYRYEPPLMDGFNIRRARFRADFLLPQFDTYVEYWGLAYTDRRYAQKMNYKMEYYRRHNLRLISIYPNNMSNLDSLLRHELSTGSRYCTNCGS
jgi:hypothetical protein